MELKAPSVKEKLPKYSSKDYHSYYLYNIGTYLRSIKFIHNKIIPKFPEFKFK